MGFTERFERVFETPVGQLLVFLLVAVALLGAIYGVMLWRKRAKDVLAYKFRAYFERAEEIASAFKFVGEHRAELLGRETSVQFPNRTYGLCLIPPPPLVDADVLARMSRWYRVLGHKKIPHLAPVVWHHENEVLINVSGQLLKHDGHRLLHLRHFLADKRLGKAYTEEILVEISKTLSALHQQQDDEGNPLYHGLLLPRSLFIDFDVNRSLEQIIVADAGMLYAIGADKIGRQLKLLRAGKLTIERFASNAWLEQQAMLAPELDQGKAGPASDLYSFGALAVLMFTGQLFSGNAKVDWESIPRQWQPFLQRCLADDPRDRPQDFDELSDWLEDPDLALTAPTIEGSSDEVVVEEVDDLQSLASTLHKVQRQRLASASTSSANSGDPLSKGARALQQGRWPQAKQFLSVAIEQNATHAEAHVNMAIACYELGELDEAEHYYRRAKELDPNMAKFFREHIAFRV